MIQTFTPKTISQTYDVVVAGGGLAGVMAAIAATREGKNVILLEKYGFLGGMATSALVNPFMSWFENGGGPAVNAGLFKALQQRMFELGGAPSEHSASFLEEFMKIALDRMTREYGVKVLFHALISQVETDDGYIKSLTVSTVSGNIRISGRIFVDATGNADVCAFAGLPYRQGREQDGLCQPMTLCFRLSHIQWEAVDWARLNTLYREKQLSGEITNPRENILLFRLPIDDTLHFNTTRIVGKNPTDVEDVSQAEMQAREQVLEMFRFLRQNIPGMENCQLTATGAETGIRESRRVVGLYELTKEDILGAAKFDDRIARGTYDIDIHNPAGTGTVIERVPDLDYYTIPYRSLIPVQSQNLIVAGRPICSTHEAHSSIRIMPITTCLGEAAGTACALALDKDCAMKDVPISLLQDRLTGYGALV